VSAATSRRVVVVDSLEALREEWSALSLAAGNVFSTFEWAETWWRHYGRERPRVVACRDGADTVALLPLYVWSRRPVRVGRFIGHGPADQLGPISASSGGTIAAEALLRAVEHVHVDLVLAELLPGREDWRDRLGERPLLVESSPTISLEGGWNAYLERRSANLRQQIRRRERRLDRRHAIRFRLAATPDRLEDDLTLLFALHRLRWGREQSAFERFERFHREFARVALERGWLRLWFLEVDERPAAAWYGFRFSGVESYYQAGRDPRLRDASVGFILLTHSIREAAQDGMTEYRLLRGAESFKQRLADGDRGVETFAIARGLRGLAARRAAAVSIRSNRARSTLRGFAHRSAVP
jgi:CelD/BcsL family acetyltransferase involved in cellulose biosynthesis